MLTQDFSYLRVQHTVAAPIRYVGIGLHSGVHVTMRILPAEADTGISFTRRDLPRGENRFLARWDQVSGTVLSTTLGNRFGHHLATVEHLLAAFHGLGIDNAEVILDGPEVPIVDGSALPFVTALCNTGIKPLETPRDVYLVRRPVRVQQGERWAELLPDRVPRITLSIDFPQLDIGHQSLSLCLSPLAFLREIAPARTFGFAEHLSKLRRRGLALGGSIRNAILLEGGRVKNLEGLRYPDEFVRHKTLDVIGDLALAEHPIIGHYRAHRAGHKLNNELLSLFLHDRQSWQRIAATDLLDGRINGFDQTLMGVGGEEMARSSQASSRFKKRTADWHELFERAFGRTNEKTK
ncbi:MAG: UDP-3-O-acyl-N-acetylglucosamine deacetylase [Chromatiales bacterium]|jgi:UDP-3-O-[3-hydroxymyristoyl] N-acetylglucosamine deacetylase